MEASLWEQVLGWPSKLQPPPFPEAHGAQPPDDHGRGGRRRRRRRDCLNTYLVQDTAATPGAFLVAQLLAAHLASGRFHACVVATDEPPRNHVDVLRKLGVNLAQLAAARPAVFARCLHFADCTAADRDRDDGERASAGEVRWNAGVAGVYPCSNGDGAVSMQAVRDGIRRAHDAAARQARNLLVLVDNLSTLDLLLSSSSMTSGGRRAAALFSLWDLCRERAAALDNEEEEEESDEAQHRVVSAVSMLALVHADVERASWLQRLYYASDVVLSVEPLPSGASRHADGMLHALKGCRGGGGGGNGNGNGAAALDEPLLIHLGDCGVRYMHPPVSSARRP